jgi:hypothetical protein
VAASVQILCSIVNVETTWIRFHGLIPSVPSQLHVSTVFRSSKDERNDLEDLLADSGERHHRRRRDPLLTLEPGSSPRRKRTRFTKHIRLFGWDLFGRRQPIRLPDDDEEDEEAMLMVMAGDRSR